MMKVLLLFYIRHNYKSVYNIIFYSFIEYVTKQYKTPATY